MSKKQWYQSILLPAIFVFLISAVLSTGYAGAAYYYDDIYLPFDSSVYIEVKPDGTLSEY
jgi:hypothetical protein